MDATGRLSAALWVPALSLWVFCADGVWEPQSLLVLRSLTWRVSVEGVTLQGSAPGRLLLWSEDRRSHMVVGGTS